MSKRQTRYHLTALLTLVVSTEVDSAENFNSNIRMTYSEECLSP